MDCVISQITYGPTSNYGLVRARMKNLSFVVTNVFLASNIPICSRDSDFDDNHYGDDGDDDDNDPGKVKRTLSWVLTAEISQRNNVHFLCKWTTHRHFHFEFCCHNSVSVAWRRLSTSQSFPHRPVCTHPEIVAQNTNSTLELYKGHGCQIPVHHYMLHIPGISSNTE